LCILELKLLNENGVGVSTQHILIQSNNSVISILIVQNFFLLLYVIIELSKQKTILSKTVNTVNTISSIRTCKLEDIESAITVIERYMTWQTELKVSIYARSNRIS
jgi:hypothetical protein